MDFIINAFFTTVSFPHSFNSLSPCPNAPLVPRPGYSQCDNGLIMDDAFARPIDQVLANFKVDERAGLSDKQVEELRNKFGKNGT